MRENESIGLVSKSELIQGLHAIIKNLKKDMEGEEHGSK
jgi:hypothetical protein